MRTTRAVLLGIALCFVWAGCEEREFNPFIARAGFDPAPVDGLWTGRAEITSAERTTPLTGTGAVTDGFVFPVALELRFDRSFTLRSFGYPIVGAPEEDKRFCAGVFSVRGNTIDFFPDDICPALPLSHFTIGRSFPRGLELDARTRPATPGQVFGEAVSIRVHFHLERESRRPRDFR